MTPHDEAAAILTRLFESLARASGKTLKESTRADIKRACELLSSASADYDLLDDLVRQTPAEAAVSFVEAANADPRFQEWQRARRQGRQD